MVTFQDVEVLTTKKEGNCLEFKESTGQLNRSMEAICAFLNGEGGTILYGVIPNKYPTSSRTYFNNKRQ